MGLGGDDHRVSAHIHRARSLDGGVDGVIAVCLGVEVRYLREVSIIAVDAVDIAVFCADEVFKGCGRLFDGREVVEAALNAQLHLHAERTVTEEQVDARGVGAGRDLEGGQQLEVFLRELGHHRLDEPREDGLGETHGEHVVGEQHLTEQQVEDAPDVLGHYADVRVADVDDEPAAFFFRCDGGFAERLVFRGCAAREQVVEADEVHDLDALREEVAYC